MARLARVVVPGHPHHVTQRGVRSMRVFREPADYERYLDLLRAQSRRFGLEFLAWCLMPNHVHLVAVPAGEDSLARAIGEAHRRFTCARNEAEGVKGYLFQGRFFSCVLDEPHLLAAVRYAELNPVRARLAPRPEDYPYSSAPARVDAQGLDPLVADPTLAGLVENWQEFWREADEPAEANLRARTRTGRPAGSMRFVKRIERLTGRVLREKKRGRKSKRTPQAAGEGPQPADPQLHPRLRGRIATRRDPGPG